MRWIIQIILGFAVLLHLPQSVSAEETEVPSLVVLPLEVSQEGSYAYLNRVINQMLLSRLSQNKDLTVLGSELTPKDRQRIRSLLQSGQLAEVNDAFNADWFIDGDMYSLKDGLQINISLYPVNGGVPVTLAVKADGEDEIIGAVGALSKDIAAAVVQEESAPLQPEKVDKGVGLTGFETPHPERDYKKGLYGGSALIAGGDGDTIFESRGMRKSDALPINIVSLAAGDLNADGVNDLVAASQSKIRVFSYNDLNFNLVAEYNFPAHMKIHVINIGDHDGDGRMKLYVSGNRGKFASSAILSWDGSKKLQLRKEAIPWYIRPVKTPEGKTILIGQQANLNQDDDFLQPGVFELSIDQQDARVQKGNRLLLPEGTNVFDFIQADLDGDGQIETAVIDKKQKLLVYDSAFNLIWVSSANYGGSMTYFGPLRNQSDQQDIAGLSEGEQDLRQLVFIPGRLDTKDITGDGLPEIVVSTNNVGVNKYLENSRFYDGGSVACLGWYGQGLAELWQTNHIEGYVADYFFDKTEDSSGIGTDHILNRLYVGQIPVTSFMKKLLPGGDESRILAYEMVVKKSRDAGLE